MNKKKIMFKEQKKMDTKKIDRLGLHNSIAAIKAKIPKLRKTDKLITSLIEEVETLQHREDAYLEMANRLIGDYEAKCEKLAGLVDTLEIKIADLNNEILHLRRESKKRSVSMQDYMSRKKENMEKFTHSIYGWEANKKDELVPNWEEQEVISSMREMLENGSSASKVAKILNEIGISGSKGGKWTSSSVLRTVRGKFHENLDKFMPPE